MPLRSQILARQETRETTERVVVIRSNVQATTIETTERDPRSGLLIGIDRSGNRRQVNDLSAGSSLGRILPAILIESGSPGAIAS